MTLSTFFYTMIGKRMGLRTANLARESVTADDRTDVKRLLRTIVLLTLCFEGAGAALMLPYFLPDYGGYGVFMSVFFAVSSYCNAGFDLLGILSPGTGMGAMFYAEGLHTVMSLLIICGGLGFVVWQDLYAYRKRRALLLHTKVVLFTAVVLYRTGDAPDYLDALFETVSAFSTTGLTVGVIANTGVLSRIVLIAAMFLGRVGPMAFVLSFTISEKRSRKAAPLGRIWVG